MKQQRRLADPPPAVDNNELAPRSLYEALQACQFSFSVYEASHRFLLSTVVSKTELLVEYHTALVLSSVEARVLSMSSQSAFLFLSAELCFLSIPSCLEDRQPRSQNEWALAPVLMNT